MESVTQFDQGFLGQPWALFSGRLWLEGLLVRFLWLGLWVWGREGEMRRGGIGLAYRMKGLISSLEVCHAFGMRRPKSVCAIMLCMS